MTAHSNQYFLDFNESFYLVIQVYFQCNLFFISNGFLVNSILPSIWYTYTHVWPSGESLTNFVALLCIEVVYVLCHCFIGTEWLNEDGRGLFDIYVS